MLSSTHLVDGNTIAACQYRRLWKLEATVNCINQRSTTCFVLPKSVLWVSYYLLCFIIAVNSSLAICTFRNAVDKFSFKMSHVDLIQQGLILRWGYVPEYWVVNQIVVKRVLFKWLKLRWVHGQNRLVNFIIYNISLHYDIQF